VPHGEMLGVSAKTGVGLPELTRRLADIARDRLGDLSSPAITRERYRQEFKRCMHALQEFMNLPAGEHELRAEDLRIAANAVGRITGRVDAEDILGEIFARFCIGK
jgi:tRNA modification GTPase